MRYGKPIKNKNRVDPRYFLNEQVTTPVPMKRKIIMPDGEEIPLQWKDRNKNKTKAALALWQLRNPEKRMYWAKNKPIYWIPRPGHDFGAKEAKDHIYSDGLEILADTFPKILDQILGGHFKFKPEKLEDYGIQAPPPTERPPKAQPPADPDAGEEELAMSSYRGEFYPDRFYDVDNPDAFPARDEIHPDVWAGGLAQTNLSGVDVDPEYEDQASMPGRVTMPLPTSTAVGPRVQTDADRAAHDASATPAADTAETNEEKLKRLLRDRGVNLDYVRLKGKRFRPMIPRGTHALLKKAKKLEKRGGDKWDKFKQSEKYLKAKNSWQARGVWNKFKKLSKGYYGKKKAGDVDSKKVKRHDDSSIVLPGTAPWKMARVGDPPPGFEPNPNDPFILKPKKPKKPKRSPEMEGGLEVFKDK